MTARVLFVVSGLGLSLMACTPTEVAFVTDTTIGVDADSKLGRVTIAYDRVHGMYGPKYDSGDAPPVVASIKTDAHVFNPHINQVYATGSAAVLATSNASPAAEPQTASTNLNFMKGANPRGMFFGTSSTVGFKLSFSDAQLASVTLGYKRREISVIPLHSVTIDSVAGYTYAPVLASIDLGGNDQSFAASGLDVEEFFATGAAAENLARNPKIQARFRAEAEASLAKTFDQQDAAAKLATDCYNKASSTYYLDIWTNAQNLNLITPEELARLRKFYTDAAFMSDDTEAARKAKLEGPADQPNASPYYRGHIALRAEDFGTDPTRAARLTDHAKFVCGKVS